MSIKDYFKEHHIAILVALFVGFVYVAPNIFFILSLGDEYRGIPMMHTANDDFYIARIQEILDGHPLVGSQAFYEYKNQTPLAPPVGEMLYAVPAMLFEVKPAAVIVASQFFLPLILFLLVYALLLKLFEDDDSFFAKINAIAGALLVTLGYDLIDYRSLLAFLSGSASPAGFLIWARPINPVLGALLLMAFLGSLWRMIANIRNERPHKRALLSAAIFLALMVGSYFFSWGIAVSILVMLALMYVLKKEYTIVKSMGVLAGYAFLMTLPYWYLVWQASKSPWYAEALLRNGIFYTHYPLMNKLLFLVLIVYAVFVGWQFIRDRKNTKLVEQKTTGFIEDWHLFTLAFILGSLWAYSQQIITGQTVWPYHFVQYSIPLAMIVLMVLWYRIVRHQLRAIWAIGVFFAVAVPLVYGVYIQAGTFNRFYQYDANLQLFWPTLKWLDEQEKNCVVLANENEKEPYVIIGLIPAFTHCDVYASPWSFSLMPIERSYYNYAVQLRMRGITDDHIEEYVKEHIVEARDFIFSDWKDLYGVSDFPDFVSRSLDERIGNFADIYRRLAAINLEDMLRTYRLDYIVSQGTLPQKILNELHGPNIVFQDNNLFVYRFDK
ncbi:MAG: hypothetical protein HYT28_00190 [Parcubacteria group bacterium]|nr:hypothetical protein [Parcubacteria group bacterium]